MFFIFSQYVGFRLAASPSQSFRHRSTPPPLTQTLPQLREPAAAAQAELVPGERPQDDEAQNQNARPTGVLVGEVGEGEGHRHGEAGERGERKEGRSPVAWPPCQTPEAPDQNREADEAPAIDQKPGHEDQQDVRT